MYARRISVELGRSVGTCFLAFFALGLVVGFAALGALFLADGFALRAGAADLGLAFAPAFAFGLVFALLFARVFDAFFAIVRVAPVGLLVFAAPEPGH
jgi:hypothetical protein